jgi:hypothetical protein
MAFAGTSSIRWPLPLAAFELENHAKDDRVAYSLWKVLCLRVGLRVVFAYRPDWERSRQLVNAVAADVIGGCVRSSGPLSTGRPCWWLAIAGRRDLPVGLLQVLDAGRQCRPVREGVADGRVGRGDSTAVGVPIGYSSR